ncbi:contractile injection system protein, VgrG/Pvc8 family [Halorhodospira halophila]|uniref:Uncharacterized protein n=1 Tax=Halorhodospira halophila (strain DSM 244 / SL1) TaxID=349124 RepID=A1WTD6_HALHL|nr:contractile injection system protein, VgrG/Pvc8 family [Halorhodospira halophila]ABM60948.1 conserved hypothetical protein [Halorhodospira halophila SL1]MBK1728606.1 hypothetical protein [Halorhodospira halophila]
MGGPPQPRPWAELEVAGMRLLLRRLEGEEALSRPFRFRVTGRGDGGLEGGLELLGQPARLRWGDGLGGARSLAGRVTAWQTGPGTRSSADRFEAVIEPGLVQLANRADHRFFPRVHLEDLTRCWLSAVGYEWADPRWRVHEAPAWRCGVLQAGESDLALLQRLWAQAGVTLGWLDGAREQPLLTDSASGFPCAETELRLPGTDPARGTAEPGWRYRMQPAHPPRPAPVGLDGDVKAHWMRVRRQAQAVRQAWLDVATRRAGLGAGFRVPVVVAAEDGGREVADWGRWCLITRVRHRLTCTADAPGGGGEYRAELEAVPEIVGDAALPYRPLEPARCPRNLPIPARVCADGSRGAEAQRSGLYLPESVVRLMPLPHGARRGAWHVPLVDGERVLVGCLDGDPDAAVILGSLPVAGQDHPGAESRGQAGAYTTPGGRRLLLPGAGRCGEGHLSAVVLDAGGGSPRVAVTRGNGDHGDGAELDAGAGPLGLRAGAGGIRERAGGERRERVAGDRRVAAQGGVEGRSEQTSSFQVAGQARLGGHDSLTARAGRELRLHAGKVLQVLAADGTRLRTRQGDGCWQVERGDLRLAAGEDIVLRSRGGVVTLRNTAGSAGITVDAQGGVRIWGRQVILDAEGALRLDAEVHHRSGDR